MWQLLKGRFALTPADGAFSQQSRYARSHKTPAGARGSHQVQGACVNIGDVVSPPHTSQQPQLHLTFQVHMTQSRRVCEMGYLCNKC